ncbi:MAG TPA: integrase family protein [Terriglobales bacterium]|jgi:integrase|nr:integrase family protein [Terriglobales bacterium]
MVNQISPTLTEFATSGSTRVAQPKRKFNLTKKAIDALASPSNGQRAYFYDTKVRGLAVAVSPMGKKTFILYRKVAGKPERITIGPYCDLSIEQARGKAEEMNAAIADGKNPAEQKRAVRDEMTLSELFQRYLDDYAKVHKRTWRDDESTFKLHLHGWQFRKISGIALPDVVRLHAHIGRTRGHYAANRLVELLSTIFARAIEWGWEGKNPATGVTPFAEVKRERFMDGNELRAFFQSLKVEPNTTIRDFLLVALLTGARRGNVQAMRWDELDFDRATWTIPAAKAKTGDTINLALSPHVLAILETRRETAKTEWVFPGTGKSKHLIEPKTAWKRIIARAATLQKQEWLKAHKRKTEADFQKEIPNAGLPDLRMHDLRRTLGSWEAATGASLPIIGKSLGHGPGSTATAIYARLNLDPVRAAVNLATDAMLQAGNVAGLLAGGE